MTCWNCGGGGHAWQDCRQPLSPALAAKAAGKGTKAKGKGDGKGSGKDKGGKAAEPAGEPTKKQKVGKRGKAKASHW